MIDGERVAGTVGDGHAVDARSKMRGVIDSSEAIGRELAAAVDQLNAFTAALIDSLSGEADAGD